MSTQSPHHPIVLIVEDEWLLRAHARDVLENAGFDALEAADADEALRVLAEHPEVNALFTDINLPGTLDGLQLARKVYQSRPDIRLLITSGKIAPGKGQIPHEGIFLPKPYSPDAVVRSLSNLLH